MNSATSIGVTGQAISAWERGEVMPLLSNFEKLVQLVPTTEKWRDDCHDRDYTKGEKPEGFTTKRRPASSIPFVPIHVTPIELKPISLKPIEVSKAELEEAEREGKDRRSLFAMIGQPTTEEAGAHYVQTLVEYKRAIHELSQYEDRLATLRENVEAAQRRNADAAHALDEAVKREVLE
jgi:DNA-binding XRE family transcriptional regulator